MTLERITIFSFFAYIVGYVTYYALVLKATNVSFVTASFLLMSLYLFYKLYTFAYPYIMASDKELKPDKNEWAIITGCTSGLGRSMSFKLSKKGFNLLLIARNSENLNNLINDLKSINSCVSYIGLTHDFASQDKNKISEFYNTLHQMINDGNIGLLVNNVGVANDITEEFHKYGLENDMELVDVNLKSMLLMTKLVIPEMIKNKKGIIINISSGSAYQASPYISTYGATKAFMRHFSNSIRKEYEQYGIKVYVCLPLFFLSNIVKEKESILIPKSDIICDGILSHCTIVGESCPYLPHFIQHMSINCNWVPNLSFKFLHGLYKKRHDKQNY